MFLSTGICCCFELSGWVKLSGLSVQLKCLLPVSLLLLRLRLVLWMEMFQMGWRLLRALWRSNQWFHYFSYFVCVCSLRIDGAVLKSRPTCQRLLLGWIVCFLWNLCEWIVLRSNRASYRITHGKDKPRGQRRRRWLTLASILAHLLKDFICFYRTILRAHIANKKYVRKFVLDNKKFLNILKILTSISEHSEKSEISEFSENLKFQKRLKILKILKFWNFWKFGKVQFPFTFRKESNLKIFRIFIISEFSEFSQNS